MLEREREAPSDAAALLTRDARAGAGGPIGRRRVADSCADGAGFPPGHRRRAHPGTHRLAGRRREGVTLSSHRAQRGTRRCDAFVTPQQAVRVSSSS
eukprot:5467989-Pyramimonas_sp.AAC.1